MSQYILRNVSLNKEVEAFASEHFKIVSVDELTDDIAPQIEVLLTNGKGKAPKALLDRLPNLKMIDDFGVGYDGVDIEECKKRNIAVCTTPGVLTEDVADLAMSLIFAVSRQICLANNLVKQGEWAQGKKLGLGHKVSGKKVGIVGLGRIGKAVAQRCAGFDMQISYFDRFVEHESYQRYDNLIDLAQNVDILVLCAAATAEDRHLVSTGVLKALGPDGMLINVARGSLVNEKALVQAIEDKSLGYCGLDVFEEEPHAPQELFNCPNVVFTPHIASATHETRKLMAEIVIGNLKAFMEQKPLLTPLKL